jgi:hypothetical protein
MLKLRDFLAFFGEGAFRFAFELVDKPSAMFSLSNSAAIVFWGAQRNSEEECCWLWLIVGWGGLFVY